MSLGSVYALIALGYTLVYGVLQLINFAHSEIVMLGAFLGLGLAGFLPPGPSVWSFALATAGSMAVCALAGVLLERLAYRPLRKRPRLNSLITAIGVSLLIQSLAQLPWLVGASPYLFPSLLPNRPLIHSENLAFSSVQGATFLFALALMGALHRLIFHSRFGMAMRAVSFDPNLASLMGVRTNKVISLTFALGSALAAAGGILVSLNYPRIEATMGTMLGLKAFVAAVLGGIGHVRGAMLGGLLMGLIESLVVGYGSSSYRDAVAFGLLILILILKPAGLMGRHRPEKV